MFISSFRNVSGTFRGGEMVHVLSSSSKLLKSVLKQLETNVLQISIMHRDQERII